MFQNKSIPVVDECHSKVLQFTRLRNELFSTEYDTNKETSSMIGEMTVTADKALLADIWDEKNINGGASVKCWGKILLG